MTSAGCGQLRPEALGDNAARRKEPARIVSQMRQHVIPGEFNDFPPPAIPLRSYHQGTSGVEIAMRADQTARDLAEIMVEADRDATVEFRARGLDTIAEGGGNTARYVGRILVGHLEHRPFRQPEILEIVGEGGKDGG